MQKTNDPAVQQAVRDALRIHVQRRPVEQLAAQRKLAVLFPGFGYACDRPLLYYARRAAEQAGCEVLPLCYPPDFPAWRDNLHEAVRKGLPAALQTASVCVSAAQLRYHVTDLYFVGKSFGAVVAAALAREYRGAVHLLQLTPLDQGLSFLEGQACTAATGTADPYFSSAARRAMEQMPGVELHIFPRANHSLEVPGDLEASVSILQALTTVYQDFFSV